MQAAILSRWPLAGEHTIAVRSGPTWSDPVRFYFEK